MDTCDRLLAIEEIKKLKARYFRCVDTKDAEGYGNVFTPDGVLDLQIAYQAPNRSPSAGSPDNFSLVLKGRAQIAELSRTRGGSRISVHHGHMPEIDIESETRATGIWSMEDIIWYPSGKRRKGYGHYHEIYEHLETGWHIKYCKLTRLYLDPE